MTECSKELIDCSFLGGTALDEVNPTRVAVVFVDEILRVIRTSKLNVVDDKRNSLGEKLRGSCFIALVKHWDSAVSR